MTMRQVSACLFAISDRKNNQHAFEAALHGIKLPVKQKITGEPVFDEQFNKRAEQAMKEAIARKRAKYGK